MSDTPLPMKISRREKVFPKLSQVQMERISMQGKKRTVQSGEILVEQGDRHVPFYAVLSGDINIIRPSDQGDTLVNTLGPGQFTGEVSMLSGRPVFVRIQVAKSGELIEVDHERFLKLIQTDSELSDLIMSAYILRRLNLVAYGLGDAVLIGSTLSVGTLRIRDFLTRNSHPFSYIDLDRDAEVQTLLDHFHISPGDIPVVICRGKIVLRNPSDQEVADCLDLNETLDPVHVYDLVIIGAGPAGLAAAVYGASEGLDVLMLESKSPGGQAGTSSKIENYLGFPLGISGQELAGRAFTQAEKFGAKMMIAHRVKRLICQQRPYVVEMEDGIRISAKTIVIATGAEYRRLPLANLSKFEGVGVYYAATFMEAQLCAREEVIVVGGGNSAGQAAVFLAQTAGRVHILVRSAGLAETMSRYLIRRIEETPTILLRTHTEIDTLDGEKHLERVRWRNNQTGETETHNIRHLFTMAGALPNTGWIEGCLKLDSKGFIKTGPDLTSNDLKAASWPFSRPPHLLETSLSGVFAVGDVRAGSIKRVASAVGEGSIAISFVHQVLKE